jgi:hypothetical protein
MRSARRLERMLNDERTTDIRKLAFGLLVVAPLAFALTPYTGLNMNTVLREMTTTMNGPKADTQHAYRMRPHALGTVS